MNKKLGIVLIVLIVIIAGITIAGTVMRTQKPTIEQPTATVEDTPAPSVPVTTPVVSDKNPILGTEWTWLKTTFMNGTTTTAPAGKFVIKFNDDKTLSSTTDCNGISGKFIVDDEVLSVGPLVSTRMACAGPTLETEYSQELSRTTSYVIVGKELHINLLKDTGTMIFAKR